MDGTVAQALIEIARAGALDEPQDLSGHELGERLGASQQTGSRRLIQLEEMGFIERVPGTRGHRVQVTGEGRQALAALHDELGILLDGRKEIAFQGTLTTGLGEGQYYLARPGYQQAFQRTLGWEAFPGTYNLKLDAEQARWLPVLRSRATFRIPGFEAEGRTFGGVLASHATIEGHACAVVLPNRTHHTDVLEIIAPIRLRSALRYEDGDQVPVVVRMGSDA